MSNEQEIIQALEETIVNTENVNQDYKKVLTTAGEVDVTLADGSTTPNLNKRVRTVIGEVPMITDGNVTLEDGGNQREFNTFVKTNGAALPWMPDVEYALHAPVTKIDGTLVQSTVAGNETNPNVDMTGWKKTSGNIAYASDFGLIGDGSDETENLLNILKSNIVIFESGKRYGFTGTVKTIGLIYTNGSTFECLNDHTGYAVEFDGNTQVVGGFSLTTNGSHGAIVVSSRVQVEDIVSIQKGAAKGFGFRIQSKNASRLDKVKTGRIFTYNYVSHIQLFDIERSCIRAASMANYTTGLYIKDMLTSGVGNVYADTMLPNSTGAAGQNALLIEASYNGGVSNSTIGNVFINQSPEHGVRFGGKFTIENMNIGVINTKLTGSGSTPTGGASLKILGGSTATPPNKHRNITIQGIIAEDCRVGAGINNFASLWLGFCEGITVLKHSVRKSMNPKYSCTHGIFLMAVSDVVINSSVCLDYNRTAVSFSTHELGSAYPEFDKITDIKIDNVIFGRDGQATAGAAIYFNSLSTEMSNISIRGTVVADTVARSEAVPTLHSNITLDLCTRPLSSDTSGIAPPLQLKTMNVLCNIVGDWYGTYGPTCSQGSTFTDPNLANPFKFRTQAGWVSPQLT